MYGRLTFINAIVVVITNIFSSFVTANGHKDIKSLTSIIVDLERQKHNDL